VLVRVEKHREVATLTLDSPSNRNALSSTLVAQLAAALDSAAGDPHVRAVVLTATGTTFCSGADLSETGTPSAATAIPDVLATLWELPKPVVLRLNGHARAGGIGLVAASDVVVAAESATFAFTEVRIGVAPAIISVPLLRKLSPSAARRYLLTGETFDARQAIAAGLVTLAVPDAELDDATERIVEHFRAAEPHAVETTKQLIRDIPVMSFDQGMTFAAELSQRLFLSPEAAEGIRSFREKRPAPWVVPPS
jgi:enoyl-CoA hydratase/carnithine racemase